MQDRSSGCVLAHLYGFRIVIERERIPLALDEDPENILSVSILGHHFDISPVVLLPNYGTG